MNVKSYCTEYYLLSDTKITQTLNNMGVLRKGKHFYVFRNPVIRKRTINIFLVILWLNLYPSFLFTFNEHGCTSRWNRQISLLFCMLADNQKRKILKPVFLQGMVRHTQVCSRLHIIVSGAQRLPKHRIKQHRINSEVKR